MQEFFQIKQEEGQSVTSFYENVIRKYRKARQFITEQQLITVLQTGVQYSLKEHLIRNEKDIKRPEEWLRYVREEEYIQKRIEQQRNNCYYEIENQPFFEPILPTATIKSSSSNIQSAGQHTVKPYHNYQKQHQQLPRLINNQSSQQQNFHQNMKRNRTTCSEKKMHKFYPCLVCNRKNHTPTKCFYRKDNSCFECGR